MNVTLITPTPPDISSFGVRSLSAYLRSMGHETTIIFLPGGIDMLQVEGEFVYVYRPAVIADIIDICATADIIGVSFMTQYFDRAIQITEALRKRTDTPIVWGGVHPTLRPEESLAWADYVVEGEGEVPLARLLEFQAGSIEWSDVPNTWRNIEGRVESPNDLYWMNDIESLPPMDFSLLNHFVYDTASGRVAPLTEDLLQRILPRMPYFHGSYRIVYRTMTSRGCPHQCAYCFNQTFRQRYCTGTYLRRRSVENVITEIRDIIARFPFIEGLHFFDDSFFANSMPWLQSFARQYHDQIGLPFYCQGSPEAITQAKMELLLSAGMVFCEMGIQTGSVRIAELYHRHSTNDQIIRAMTTIDAVRHRLLRPHYHVIVDCPWESVDDVRQTIEILLRIPHPFMLCLASLTLFPGTELSERALKEGIIKDPIKDVYRKAFYKPLPTWTNLIITLTDHEYFPRGLLRLMASPRWISLLQRDSLRPVWRFTMAVDRLIRYGFKLVDVIRYGNFWRITQYFSRH